MTKFIVSLFLFLSFYSFAQIKENDSINKIVEKQIQEVTIYGRKKLIERKVDRIVYRVSDDDFNKGSNLLTALNRAPRVQVENEAIKIIGKSGSPKIMIDGRIQNLSEDAIKAKLKSLRAEQIAKIEIIPIPPSKYSAEGNAGMINIIMKKDENLGLQGNGNVDNGIQFGKVSTSQGLNLNYKIKKLDITTNLNHNDGNFTNDNRLTYDFDKTTTTIKTLPEGYYKMNSANAIIQYKPTDKFTIGSSLDFGENRDGGDNPSTTEYYNKVSNKIDSLMYSNNKNASKSSIRALSLFSDYVLDSLGKKVSITYNYSYNKNYSDSFSNSDVYGAIYRNKQFTNTGDNRYKINGILLDFELPFSFGKIETGGAFTQINNNSSVMYFDAFHNIDFSQTNEFEYREKTWATYASYQKEWSKKWTTKLGLRMESTNIKGYSPTLQTLNTNNYTKLFPTVFISYNPNEHHSFSLSYSKRLDRPSFYDLNPFRYYTNAYNYFSGNPYLLPTYTYAIEFSYTLNSNLNFIAYGNYITNGISYISEIDSNNAFVSNPSNNFKQKKAGFIGNYNWKIYSWNSLNINAEGYYTNLISEKAVQKIEGFGGSFSLRNSINLNKSKTSLLQLNYIHYLPSKAVFSDFQDKYKARFGINLKQMFLNKSLVFDLFFTDVFRQNISVSEKKYDTFHFSQYNDIRNRGIYLSVSYDFGNNNIEGIARDNKNIDSNRALKTK